MKVLQLFILWFIFYSRTMHTELNFPSILIGVKLGWIINKLNRSKPIQQWRHLSAYHVRLLNKFQSFILIKRPPFRIPIFFLLFNHFVFWTCSILLELIIAMTGYNSDLPTYLLHCTLLFRNATNR